MNTKLFLVMLLTLAPELAWAAGSGAGAGGAGRQNAINSGLPPGEPGPPGAVNNRTPPPPPTNAASPEPKPGAP